MTTRLRHKSFQHFTQSLVLMCCIALMGCEKLTEENYELVENGMSQEVVYDLLGEPKETKAKRQFGLNAFYAFWANDQFTVRILFANDTVKSKALIRTHPVNTPAQPQQQSQPAQIPPEDATNAPAPDLPSDEAQQTTPDTDPASTSVEQTNPTQETEQPATDTSTDTSTDIEANSENISTKTQ